MAGGKRDIQKNITQLHKYLIDTETVISEDKGAGWSTQCLQTDNTSKKLLVDLRVLV